MTAWGKTDETIASQVRRCTNPECDGRKGEPLKVPFWGLVRSRRKRLGSNPVDNLIRPILHKPAGAVRHQ